MTSEEHSIQIEELLLSERAILRVNFLEIAEAFQVASGQGFAIGKVLGMMNFLLKGHSFLIKDFDGEGKHMQVRTAEELADLFKRKVL